jgi:hypothetical protein
MKKITAFWINGFSSFGLLVYRVVSFGEGLLFLFIGYALLPKPWYSVLEFGFVPWSHTPCSVPFWLTRHARQNGTHSPRSPSRTVAPESICFLHPPHVKHFLCQRLARGPGVSSRNPTLLLQRGHFLVPPSCGSALVRLAKILDVAPKSSKGFTCDVWTLLTRSSVHLSQYGSPLISKNGRPGSNTCTHEVHVKHSGW